MKKFLILVCAVLSAGCALAAGCDMGKTTQADDSTKQTEPPAVTRVQEEKNAEETPEENQPSENCPDGECGERQHKLKRFGNFEGNIPEVLPRFKHGFMRDDDFFELPSDIFFMGMPDKKAPDNRNDDGEKRLPPHSARMRQHETPDSSENSGN